jgi:MFS family permease
MLSSCALIGMGLFIPYAYLEDMGKQNKLEMSDVPILFTVMGAANTAGRVFCGFIANLPKVRAELLLASALCVAGTSCVALPLLGGYGFKLFIVYTITFGFFIAFFFSLLSVVLADLMGLEHLTNAFGIVGMFLGIFTILGTPFAGFLYESTEDFDLSFYVAGCMIIMSGITIFPVKVVNRWEKRRKEKREEQK